MDDKMLSQPEPKLNLPAGNKNDNKKHISTLAGTIIIIVVAVLLFGGVFAWQYFSSEKITNSTLSITVISPNGNEILEQNKKYTIKWDYSGLNADDEIDIVLRSVDYSPCFLGSSIVSKDSFDFTPENVVCPGDTSTNRESTDLKNGGKYIVQLIVEKYSEGKGVADTSDNYFTINPNNQTAGWKTYTNIQYGFEFKYPKISKNYVFEQQWPPVVTINPNISNYSCSNLTKFPNGYGEQKEIFIDNNKYCFKIATDGAAGTIYKYYSYTTIKDNKLLIFEFTVGFTSCGVYDEPRMTACNKEQNDFNSQLNTLTNNIVSTFKFITPVNQTPVNENATGIIKSVATNSTNGKNYLDIDYVTINPNWKPGGTTGSAYTNDNTILRTFEISNNVDITVQGGNKITISQFIEIFRTTSTDYRKNNPWDVQIVNNIVTKITEYYIP